VLFYLLGMAYFLSSYWLSLPGYYGWDLVMPYGVLGTVGGSIMIAIAFIIAIGALESMAVVRKTKPSAS